MLLKFTTIISPLFNFAIGVCFPTKVVIRIRYKRATPMVGPFESLGGKLKSFYVVMVKANLPTSTTQNPWSILPTMWKRYNMEHLFQCDMTSMIYDKLRFYHPLHHLVLFGHCNYTNYCSMKGSLLSLANQANFVYMVHGIFIYFPFINLGMPP
jgi:hypothetical protein